MKNIQNKEDTERVLIIFRTAFCDSPGITWITRNSERKLDLVLRLFIEEATIKDGAYLTSDNNGAVLYFQLQNKNQSLLLILKKVYLFLFVLGIKKGTQILKYKKLVNNIRPKEGWLGWLVATDESAEGNAAAYEIKNEMFRLADESNEAIFVETTVPRVRVLYRLAGYKEYHSTKHPFKDLTIWFMKREPNSKREV